MAQHFRPNWNFGFWLAASLVVLAGLFSVAASAIDRIGQDADRTATIRTVLRGEAGAVLPGVTVTLSLQQCRCEDCKDKKKCSCCPEQRSAISDAEGAVTFVVPGGRYRIRAELAGFATQEQEIAVEGGGKSTVTMTFQPGTAVAGRAALRRWRPGAHRRG